ncbi:Ras-related protein Rab-21 [Skeletonema marinoi]|uniref:Ras-related protein Rab-21 n=1 Tax=Skeletonema marinoi TaxID=267567 RepID=A0AAD8YLU4_9STRA|nr:Ras-related protein Rab-21 [Skeletonema marinoi]
MSSTKEAIPHYKVVLLGEGRVGKTSILLRFVENSYIEGRPSTLTASYLNKHVIVDDKREAHLSIWDTAGQERFHSLGPIYYRDAKGAILICITIVGNKIDLERRRVVSQQSAKKYAEGVGATYFEVSAKTGRGVEDVFQELTKVLLDTVNPSCRSRSSLVDASSSMMGKSSGQDLHRIDLSRKEVTKSSCCS